MKRSLTIVTLGLILLSACTGSFTLTKKVHNFNLSFENKWAEEGIFLVLVIVPVYKLSMLGDALIFNTIEFWGGDNPVAATNQPMSTVAYDQLTDRIVVTEKGQPGVMLTLERGENGLLARDANGAILYHIIPVDDGGYAVYSVDGHLLQQLSPEQVASLQNRLAG